MSDADAVVAHLGYWCLLKFIELELQANLQACLVDDAENVNNRKRRQQLQAEARGRDEDDDGNDDDVLEEGEECEPAAADSDTEPTRRAATDDLAALVATKMDLDEASQQEVQPILKLLAWLDAQTKKLGVNSSAVTLRLPPCCCMLGNSNARVSGALHFSSYLKVMTLFANVETNFEVVHHDTGAVLNTANAVACLSKFCDSLPGLDTYDKRPQYVVRRHPIASGISAATKQHRKKRLKYNAKIHDKIDDCRADAEAAQLDDAGPDDAESLNLFEFSATLKIPLALGIKRKLVSHKVPSADEAKGIAAFKACQELLKKGLLDRTFRSKLLDDQTATIHCDTEDGADKANAHSGGSATTSSGGLLDDTIIIDAEDAVDTSGKLKDLSTQNSYDLPPVSAAELSLRPIRTLLSETARVSPGSSSSSSTDSSVAMCFYGLTGVRYAILTTNELYTGNTNTGWRYDFATSDVMEPTIRPVTLAKAAVSVRLTKAELQAALHFHLTIMRLVCMGVEDAMRDVDIAGEDVWKEFSEQNDKGYLVVPSCFDAATTTFSIDWAYVQDILGKPLLEPIWPFPDPTAYPLDEWICVPTHRRNVTYAVKELSTVTAREMKDLPQRLVWLQQRLKYTFTNKRLLLEAVTHPSAGHLELQACICAGAVRMDRETLDVVARLERKYPRDGTAHRSAAVVSSRSLNNYLEVSASASRKKVKATGTNPLSLPKMFADVFEALVAAVFLDSGKDLQTTRDVFLGPLLDTVGRDALAYVCHESGLTIEQFDVDAGAADQDEIMESLFSDDDED
ncbi:hypothetical protein PybrP1_012614 [[Pythium] brassicae (nom. inval.)]|nr:hypothetical protein PybrP1_012614 [[Pythium] brassicae (nom. inval.)]